MTGRARPAGGYGFETPEILQMLLRGKLLVRILGLKAIVWLEPDAAHYETLLLQPELTADSARRRTS